MKKKSKIWIYPLIIKGVLLILTSSCKKDDDNNDNNNPSNGDLKIQLKMYGQKNGLGSGIKSDTNTCALIDLRNAITSISVSTDAIIDGQTDNLNWTIIYSDTAQLLFTQRQISPVSLPVGSYKSIKIIMKNRIYWVCDFNSNTYEFEDFNCSSCDPNGFGPTNYFYSDGLHELDSTNHFFLCTPNEKLGGFDILENQTTTLTWRFNVISLQWIDVNSNGTWDTGIDKMDNWATPLGVETMMDFIVTY